MSTSRTVVAYAPGGIEVAYDTAAKWDVAGLVRNEQGAWHLAAHGFSWESVRNRTSAYYSRSPHATEWAVAALWEATAPLIAGYFGSHRVVIASVFTPEAGWVTVREAGYVSGGTWMTASKAMLRRLSRDGVAAVAVQGTGSTSKRTADFQMPEVLASMKPHRCATAGHRTRKADYRIGYSYRGEGETTREYVCGECKGHYERRPVLVNFTAVRI